MVVQKGLEDLINSHSDAACRHNRFHLLDSHYKKDLSSLSHWIITLQDKR